MKNKRNLNTKWLLLQNDQNADTTLLHSHDDLFHPRVKNAICWVAQFTPTDRFLCYDHIYVLCNV